MSFFLCRPWAKSSCSVPGKMVVPECVGEGHEPLYQSDLASGLRSGAGPLSSRMTGSRNGLIQMSGKADPEGRPGSGKPAPAGEGPLQGMRLRGEPPTELRTQVGACFIEPTPAGARAPGNEPAPIRSSCRGDAAAARKATQGAPRNAGSRYAPHRAKFRRAA